MYFYISKNITSYTFLFVFKILNSIQCILHTFISNLIYAMLQESLKTPFLGYFLTIFEHFCPKENFLRKSGSVPHNPAGARFSWK